MQSRPFGGPVPGFPTAWLDYAPSVLFALPSPGFEQVLGGHPIPNEHSLIAGQKASHLTQQGRTK